MKPPICLITPPSVFLLDEKVFPALGILRIAAVLERDGYCVEHVDLSGVGNYEEAIADHAAQSEAQVFGLTATTPQMPAVTRLVDVLRRTRPDARLILGGPHATLVNAAARKEKAQGHDGRAQRALREILAHFDVTVAGDGEDAIFHAIMPDAPKLIDADDAASALFMTNARYDAMPFPARHLIDLKSYHYMMDGVETTPCIGQLGCPYECSFCGGRNSAMLRRIRNRSTENVLEEVRLLHEVYGYRGVMFFDDELNVSRSMPDLMRGLIAMQKELGVQFRFRGFLKSNLVTEEQAELMAEAGFRWILIGFESGSPRILENIRKKATREQNSNCMAIARRHGLKVKALMSIGHAGESVETIQETKDWLLAEQPDEFDCTVITTYPGCPYYDDARETSPGTWTFTARNGDRLHAAEVDFAKDAAYYKGTPGEYKSFVWTDHLSAPEIVTLRDQLETTVRATLDIPFNASMAAIQYEHTIGQIGPLPSNILRTSGTFSQGATVRMTHDAGKKAAV